MKRYFLLALVFGLALSACRSQRDLPSPVSPPADLPSPAELQQPKPRFTANFTAEAQGVTVGGQLRMQPDSIIWGSAQKIVELGRVRLTPDSVVVYAKIMGACFRGTYDDVARRLGFRTTFAEVVEILQSDDAGSRLSAIARRMGAETAIRIEPWKETPAATFPFYVPANAKPL